MLWGLDAIKTRGESVAILLALVGARPVKEATGRVVRYELVPLAELGRPRIDVLASLSGIFRDSFSNVVDLLDDLFERAATAEGESEDMNYIKKHANKLKEQGEDRPTARLFSNPAGDYGSLVNERVGNGEWEQEEELGETWASRNAYSFGKGERENGVKRDGVLKELLGTTERIVQEIDSVEYGLSDIQEYYANTGEWAGGREERREERGIRRVGMSDPSVCVIDFTVGRALFLLLMPRNSPSLPCLPGSQARSRKPPKISRTPLTGQVKTLLPLPEPSQRPRRAGRILTSREEREERRRKG
jgi:cobalamin biosynthesis Mg chelatase CobN